MLTFDFIMFAVAILLIISVLASKLSSKLSVPALAIFLFIGMLAGSEGIGGIYFDDPQLAQSMGVVALIYILFSGGLDTPVIDTYRVLGRGVLLSTVGVLITALVVALGVYWLLDFSIELAVLVGSIVAATDAAAVFSILRTQKISFKGDTIPLLELESGSNDPMAIFLTIASIEVINQPQMPVINLASIFAQQMLIGGLLGVLLGYVAVRALNRLRLEADGLYPVFTVAFVLFAYALTALLGGSGFLAVYLMGMMMSNQTFVHKNSLSRFHDALAWLMQIAMFLALGLLVFPSELLPIAGTGVLIAIVLIFVARPLSIFILLAFSRFDFRDKVMISWVGLRGATPIVLATFPLLAGIEQADVIFDIVFFVVLVSVLLQGSTLIPVAKWLGITEPFIEKPKYPLEPTSNTDLRSELIEVRVPAESSAVDRQIVNLGLPADSLIVLISRRGEIVVPNGNTIIEANDTLLLLADREALPEIRACIQAPIIA
ncbi:MAG: potassium/proton antiporter [Anaerolineae bacterium]